MPPPFVHLGARSAFSLGHALARPEELARQAAHLGHGALALADTMTLAGAPAFFAAARRLGIKPIPALDVRVRRLATSLSPRRHFRVRLLAEDATGWRRLVRLCSLGATRETAHLTWDEVLAEPAGLIFLPGGLDSELAEEGNASLADDAQALLERLVTAAGNDAVAIALPNPSAPGGARAVRLLAAMAAHFQLPAVAVPDVDLLHPEDGLLLELLRRDASMPRPATLGDLRRPDAEIPWLRPADDVAALYGDAHAVALENAALLAGRCEGAPPAATGHRFPLADFRRGEDPDSYLWNKCFELAAARHGERPVRWRERLNREFQQLTEAGLVDAVLFSARLHQDLEERGVVRGPGAGILSNSLAGSLLGLTQVDPLQFDLGFEPPEGKARRAPRIELVVAARQLAEAEEALLASHGAHARRLGQWKAWTEAAVVEALLEAAGAAARKGAALVKTAAWRRAAEAASRAPIGQFPDPALPLDGEPALAWLAARLVGKPRRLAPLGAEFVLSPSPAADALPAQQGPGGELLCAWDVEDAQALDLARLAFASDPMLDLSAAASDLVPWRGASAFNPLRVDPADGRTAALLREGDTQGVALLEAPSLRARMRAEQPEDLRALARLLAQHARDAAPEGEAPAEPTFREAALAWQCAAVKAHEPEAFLAAALTQRARDPGAVAALLDEARTRGIALHVLDINLSTWGWGCERRALRPGLCTVQALNQVAAEEIEVARREMDFQDLASLLRRCHGKRLRTPQVEALARAGALDNLGFSRAALLDDIAHLEPLLRPDRGPQPDGASLDFFGQPGDWWIDRHVRDPQAIPTAEDSAGQRRALEREACGLSLQGEEPADWARFRRAARAQLPGQLLPRQAGRVATLWGLVAAWEPDPADPGHLLADVGGVTLRASATRAAVLRRCRRDGEPLLAAGILERERGHWRLHASSIAVAPWAILRAERARGIEVLLAGAEARQLKELDALLKSWPGETPVRLRAGAGVHARLAARVESRRVLLAPGLEAALDALLGPAAWRAFVDAPELPAEELERAAIAAA